MMHFFMIVFLVIVCGIIIIAHTRTEPHTQASDLSFYPPLLFLHGCKIKAEVGGLDDTRLTHTYTEEGEVWL